MQTELRSPETLGPYTLIREIGRGGMSVVHQAVDRRTGKTVALKAHTVPPSLSSQERNAVMVRFAREARTVAGMSHPNVVAIHEVGAHDGTHFLAMEYLDGETLHKRLERGPLTPAQALPILSQVAAALDAVHAAGIVHRDIKPSNVMLLPEGGMKLLDFGVARQSEDTTVTATHSIVGSPTYMAPEQVQGELGDAPSDRWALGVLLYEMLAGRPPFEGASIPSVLFKVVHQEPAPVPHLSAPIQNVLRHALEKDPQRRYPTARALANALQDAVPSSPASARTFPGQRWGPWAAVLVAGAALGVCLVLTHHGRSPAPSRSDVPFQLPSPAPTAPAPPTTAPVTPPMPSAPHVRRHHARADRPTAPNSGGVGGGRTSRPHSSPEKRQRHKRTRTLPTAESAPAERTPRQPSKAPLPAIQSMPRRRPAPRPPGPRSHLPPSSAPVSLEPTRLRPEASPAPPAPRPQPTQKDKDADAQRMRDLQKFIWSEGR